MAKRDKKLKTTLESYKEQIEKHFEKLDKDILEKKEFIARYHIREINNSLIASLEKIRIILSKRGKETQEEEELIDKYKRKLEEYKKKISMEE